MGHTFVYYATCAYAQITKVLSPLMRLFAADLMMRLRGSLSENFNRSVDTGPTVSWAYPKLGTVTKKIKRLEFSRSTGQRPAAQRYFSPTGF